MAIVSESAFVAAIIERGHYSFEGEPTNERKLSTETILRALEEAAISARNAKSEKLTVSIVGAEIEGDLGFAGKTYAGLSLENCTGLSYIFSERSTVIAGDLFVIEGELAGVFMPHVSISGSVQFVNCFDREDGGSVDLTGATVNELIVRDCKICGPLLMNGLVSKKSVLLSSCNSIEGHYLVDGEVPLGEETAALRGTGLSTESLTIFNCRAEGSVVLKHSEIIKKLLIDSCRIVSAYDGRILEPEICVDLRQAKAGTVKITSSTLGGCLYFDEAKVEGLFEIEWCSFIGDARSALILERAHLGRLRINWLVGPLQIINGRSLNSLGDVELLGIRTEYGEKAGETLVMFPKANIGGSFLIGSGRSDNKVKQTNLHGSIQLGQASIAGSLSIEPFCVTTDRDDAIDISQSYVGGSVLVSGICNGTISGKGMICSQSFDAGGLCTPRDSPSRKPNPPAPSQLKSKKRKTDCTIDLTGARIFGTLTLPGQAFSGRIVLDHCSCDVLNDCLNESVNNSEKKAVSDVASNGTSHLESKQTFSLVNFTYRLIQNPSGVRRDAEVRDASDRAEENTIFNARKVWLEEGDLTGSYYRFNPGPWRQCSIVLRNMGYDDAARRISIERRVRERTYGGFGLGRRIVSYSLHTIADYGYNPWKSTVYCFVVVALFSLAYYIFFQSCATELSIPYTHVVLSCDYAADSSGASRASFNTTRPAAFLFSVDAFIPFIDFGHVKSTGVSSYDNRISLSVSRVSLVGLRLKDAIDYLIMIEGLLGVVFITITTTAFAGVLSREQ